jgi:hypothetical protein
VDYRQMSIVYGLESLPVRLQAARAGAARVGAALTRDQAEPLSRPATGTSA